jgi:hypothetical protein
MRRVYLHGAAEWQQKVIQGWANPFLFWHLWSLDSLGSASACLPWGQGKTAFVRIPAVQYIAFLTTFGPKMAINELNIRRNWNPHPMSDGPPNLPRRDYYVEVVISNHQDCDIWRNGYI